ncbi:MAG: hypothetical protein MRY83_22850 [Flavobacteriales bacterium]|nr:hypothetical protein [Flavobacteriales bacterium]
MSQLAETYYLKAFQDYPYDLDDVMENLGYALSYDREHAGALYLMGCMQMEQFENFELAEEYFLAAIGSNPNYFKAFKMYASMTIRCREFGKTEGLLQHMFKIKGADWASIYQLQGLWCEYQGQFEEAVRSYKLSRDNAFNDDYMYFINNEIERAKSKVKPKGEWTMEMM